MCYINSKRRCIYTNVENGLIIDLTSDRKLRAVQNWISRLPQKDCVECVTMDMWDCYRDAVKYPLFKEFVDTVENWRTEIFNDTKATPDKIEVP